MLFAYDTARYVTSRTLFPWTWTFPFPPLPISYCIVYIVSLWTQICINTWHVASLKGRQIGPSFPLHLCAFPGNCGPFSLSFHLSLHLYLAHLPYPTSALDKSLPPSTNLWVPSHHCLLTSRLECCAVTYACGSGNNKLCTPLLVTLTHIPSLGMLHSFILYLHTSELTCGHPLCLQCPS